MLKREIKYTTPFGEDLEEEFYFNLNKTEIIELQLSFKDGISAYMTKIIRANDEEKIYSLIKKFILLSYGVRSEDGKHFLKSQELIDSFISCYAYNALFSELSEDADKAATFIKSIMPQAFQEEYDKALAAGTQPSLPTPKV